jgi:hypothetical protein
VKKTLLVKDGEVVNVRIRALLEKLGPDGTGARAESEVA